MKKKILLGVLLLGSIGLVAVDPSIQRNNTQRTNQAQRKFLTLMNNVQDRINSLPPGSKKSSYEAILLDMSVIHSNGVITDAVVNDFQIRMAKNECSSCLSFSSYARNFIRCLGVVYLANKMLSAVDNVIDLPSDSSFTLDILSQTLEPSTTEIGAVVLESIADQVVGHLKTENLEDYKKYAEITTLPGVNVLGFDDEGNPVLSFNFDSQNQDHMATARKLIAQGILPDNYWDLCEDKTQEIEQTEENDSAVVLAEVVGFDEDAAVRYNICKRIDNRIVCSYDPELENFGEQINPKEIEPKQIDSSPKKPYTRCEVKGDLVVCS